MKKVIIKTVEEKEIGRVKLPKGIELVLNDYLTYNVSEEIHWYINRFNVNYNILKALYGHVKRTSESDKWTFPYETVRMNCSKHGDYNTWTFYTTEIDETLVKDKLEGMTVILDAFEE